MSVLVSTLVVLHILSWAVTLGLYVAGLKDRVPPKGLTHAAAAALVFGVLAWIVVMIGGATGGHLWFTLKLLFAAVATVAAFVAQKQARTSGSASAPAYHLIALAIVANVVIAVFEIGA
jgi:hypothetical protein